MSDLKPCPFCKKATYPDLIVDDSPKHYGVFAWYKCPECDTSTLGVSDPHDEDPRESAIEMARERWNTRYERTCRMDDMKTDPEGEASYDHTEHIYWCNSCHDEFSLIKYNEAGDTWCELPRFCPNCGAKVVDE